MEASQKIAILYTSGAIKTSTTEQQTRLNFLHELGLKFDVLAPSSTSNNGCTAGSALERASLLCHALTNRKYPILWGARGGYGSTELLTHLNNMLPPILPPKVLFGFSDVSFIGNYLAARFQNFTYIHSHHAFSENLTTGDAQDKDMFFELINQTPQSSVTFPIIANNNFFEDKWQQIQGYCVPINLSLAESLCALPEFNLPENNIIFIEDTHEELYRVLRKIDSLKNSGFFKKTLAVVLGEFTNIKHQGEVLQYSQLNQILTQHINLQTFSLPIFGHGKRCYPLVCLSNCKITQTGKALFEIQLTFKKEHSLTKTLIDESKVTYALPKSFHFTGIGGTGMAAVAGLLQQAKMQVTGSDQPLYSPMKETLAELKIEPAVGYSAHNLPTNLQSGIVMANALSRGNPELEAALQQDRAVYSFPSVMEQMFLKKSEVNIVVAGTHGKTTTTSWIATALDDLGFAPSFFVGGVPLSFAAGFRFKNKDLFVLEGDEYDTAFFDKSPKFLHYHPKISLLNNIEFDHADIYNNVEEIEQEFFKLVKITANNQGIIVGNGDDFRVTNILKSYSDRTILFGKTKNNNSNSLWKLNSYNIKSSGMEVNLQSPDGQNICVTCSVFGDHNAMNVTGIFAILHAYHVTQLQKLNSHQDISSLINKTIPTELLTKWCNAVQSFTGVKRRYEFIGSYNNIFIFDDFAHHPTAIATTLQAFRQHMLAQGRAGRLIACFEPRNATMRRSIMAQELAKSLCIADTVYIGKVATDKRITSDQALSGEQVASMCSVQSKYFDDNQALCDYLVTAVQPNDTIVFMSSGAFDDLPRKLLGKLCAQKSK